MKIPSKVKIGGFVISVEFVEHLVTERNNLGEYHPRTQTIRIDKSTTKQQNEETFIHELLEAIVSIYNIDIEHKDLALMGTVLHQMLIDNTEIFAK